ncbi:hypothetical protein ASPZODRAFT_68951 [Penicilliopsis zonata CBS 506.65]|uniref:SnoaL-like domain-containing protein n=1 Tax=Penicilliopsis zonata CBS 506.65 TaxID=1073090 RepID=A0A1L9SF91_9EURO|nr:hypothetical protein ASPZODRAFT_68951 [Penicilliopsis zonata CBS 506.65]OJJ45866.1 hypothetical protein ASPZODRAFT_68951 [Penicilliopsis zonata CBS 506.65]
MVYNVTEKETQPTVWSHINGTTEEIIDRYLVTELCKGWPVYRDASEWKNYRDCFVDQGGYIFTTWSGGMTIEDFIQTSISSRANGDFIMHRENGTLVDLNPKTNRAVGKMKATITQRFTLDGIEFDVECDCRFIFWCIKAPTAASPDTPVWKINFKKLFYEKDKIVPVDGKNVPVFTKEELDKYPYGYHYLGAAQAKLGHKILTDLPTMNNEGFYKNYEAMDVWLKGGNIESILGVPKKN